MNGVLNDEFCRLLSSSSLMHVFNDSFSNHLKNRAAHKKLKVRDWSILVLLSWFERSNCIVPLI